MQLRDFDIDGFLSQYWQKRPLLIRNPWDRWINPIEPDDLAGLACETEVESRLITRPGDALKLEEGPFPETRFERLGQEPWTLLVQAVDHYVPAVAALLQPFRFIPNWRIDDVMVSYATDQGGVGAHFDQYDVFLIQGLGKRRWRLGSVCDANTPLLPHGDLRLLASFEPTAEWVLEPGDILYVPPGVAHEGVAIGHDCMTYSIGFRAPSRGELIDHWSEHLFAALPDEDRYGDPNLTAQDNPGEISPAAIAGLHAMVMEKMADPHAFARWFGQYSSTPKYPDIDWRPEQPIETAELRERLSAGEPFFRNPASRFCFIREPDGVLLFVDGQPFECVGAAVALAGKLCAGDRTIDPEIRNSDAEIELAAALFNQGSLRFDPDD